MQQELPGLCSCGPCSDIELGDAQMPAGWSTVSYVPLRKPIGYSEHVCLLEMPFSLFMTK